MEGKFMKTIKKLLMALAVVAAVFCFTGVKPEAATKEINPKIYLDSTELFCKNGSFGSSVVGVPGNNYKITSVKSSNTDVIVYDKESSNPKTFFLKTVGIGKSKITVAVKVKNKVYHLSKVVEVVKDIPFSYINYGDKNIYKGHAFDIAHHDVKSGKKITWKLRKGYKIIGAYFVTKDKGNVEIKNGSKLTFKKNTYPLVYFCIQTPEKKVIYYFTNLYK